MAFLKCVGVVVRIQLFNRLLELTRRQLVLLLLQEAAAQADKDLSFDSNIFRRSLQQRDGLLMFGCGHESQGQFVFQLQVIRIALGAAAEDFDFLVAQFLQVH